MDQFLILTGKQRKSFESMIPQWLLDRYTDGMDMDFWGMVCDGMPGGAAVVAEGVREQTLMYLYVAEEYRKAGRGSAFLRELLYHAYKEGFGSFVIRYMPGQYPEFEDLLRPYPFRKEEEEVGSFSCPLQELLKIPQLHGPYGSVRPLSECSEQSLQPFYRTLVENGEAMAEVPVRKQDYLTDCCAVAWEENKPVGMLLVKKVSDQEVTIPLLVNVSHNVLAPMEMMRFVIEAGSRVLPPETICSFHVVNGSLMKLLGKIGVPGMTKRQRCTLDLSFFEAFDLKVEKEIFEELIATDYIDRI